jgi:hypothetical protein
MAEIVLKIKHCTECPHHKSEREYTGDSWETVFKIYCKKNKGKFIGYEETFENVDVPKWCPLLKKV